MRLAGAALALALAAIGCTAEPAEEPRGRVDLRQAIGAGADVDVIGVAITPDGRRFAFDADRGLYQVDGATATPVVPMAQLPDPGVEIRPPFTDIVALSPDVFAMTAIGDGFLLDIAAMTLTRHFCYEPGGFPTDLTQRTDAIGFDPALDRIYAQPRTFDGELLESAQMAGYARATGAAVEWRDVDRDIAAGGMAVVPGTGLVLGQGDRLDRYDLVADRAEHIDDLGRFGVGSIEGLALDAAAGTIVVLDGAADELVEIELARLGM